MFIFLNRGPNDTMRHKRKAFYSNQSQLNIQIYNIIKNAAGEEDETQLKNWKNLNFNKYVFINFKE